MKRFSTLLELAAFLSLLSVVAGLLGYYHYLLDLASHLRIQATFTLLFAGLALRFLKRPRSSSLSLAFGILFAALLFPYFSPNANNSSSEYRLMIMNVLTNNVKKAEVVSFIRQTNPDFAILMETDAKWIEALDSGLLDQMPHRKQVARSDNFGIALYSKLPFASCDIVNFSKTTPTPSIVATIDTDDGRLRIVATHPLPPMNPSYFNARNELFTNLASSVKNDPELTIVAGDLNCTPWSPWFNRLCRKSGLSNSMDGHGLGISWTPFNFSFLGIPIDHVLVGTKISIVRRRVGPLLGSDHRPVSVDFSVS